MLNRKYSKIYFIFPSRDLFVFFLSLRAYCSPKIFISSSTGRCAPLMSGNSVKFSIKAAESLYCIPRYSEMTKRDRPRVLVLNSVGIQSQKQQSLISSDRTCQLLRKAIQGTAAPLPDVHHASFFIFYLLANLRLNGPIISFVSRVYP